MKLLFGVINGIFALGVLLWPVMLFLVLFFGIFLFDAPGSENNVLLKAFVISLLAYPIPVVVGSLLYWVKAAHSSTLQKTLHTAVTGSGYIAIAVLLVILEVVCFGKTNCAKPPAPRVYSQPAACLEIEPMELRVGDYHVIRGQLDIVSRSTYAEAREFIDACDMDGHLWMVNQEPNGCDPVCATEQAPSRALPLTADTLKKADDG